MPSPSRSNPECGWSVRFAPGSLLYEVMDHPVQMSVRGAKQAGNLPDMVGFQLHPKGRIDPGDMVDIR